MLRFIGDINIQSKDGDMKVIAKEDKIHISFSDWNTLKKVLKIRHLFHWSGADLKRQSSFLHQSIHLIVDNDLKLKVENGKTKAKNLGASLRLLYLYFKTRI